MTKYRVCFDKRESGSIDFNANSDEEAQSLVEKIEALEYNAKNLPEDIRKTYEIEIDDEESYCEGTIEIIDEEGEEL